MKTIHCQTPAESLDLSIRDAVETPQAKHTPGPWIAFESKEEKGIIYIQKQIREDRVFPAWAIAMIPNYQNNDLENARLIAAAPELLAALIAIRESMQSDADACAIDGETTIDAETVFARVRALDSAIAKAKGGAL